MASKEKMRGVFEKPPGSGVWWISYFDGEHVWHREKIGRRSVAIEAYVNVKREIREGRYVPRAKQKAKITFAELAKRAMADREARLAPETCRADGRVVRRFDFGELPAASITPAMVDAALLRIRDVKRAAEESGPKPERLSGDTLNLYRVILQSIFSYGVRHGEIAVNPVAKSARFKVNERRERMLDQGEELALRQAIREGEFPEREHSIELALNTGMRRGEFLSLRWVDVSLERGQLTVRGKTGKRYIPINQRAREALQALHKISAGSPMVSPGWSQRWWETSLAKSGVDDFHWHDLRHTFASRLVMAGVDLSTVQKVMGHNSILTTMRYAHLSPGHTQDAVAKLDFPATNTATNTGEAARPKLARQA